MSKVPHCRECGHKIRIGTNDFCYKGFSDQSERKIIIQTETSPKWCPNRKEKEA